MISSSSTRLTSMRDGQLREKGKTMTQPRRRRLWRSAAFAAAIFLFACPAANAKDSSASVKDAEQNLARGNLKAADIELRNAIREAPENPVLRARLAEV